MAGYLLRRLFASLPTLLGITVVAFVILNLLPTDPVLTWAESGTPMSAGDVARLRAQLGADEPAVTRYARWVMDAARLDFGNSLRDQRPVAAMLGETLPWTLLLNLCAVLAIYGLAVPLGWAFSRYPDSIGDRVGRALLLLSSVVPPFAAALLLQRFFSVRWRLLPLAGVASPDLSGSTGLPGLATLFDLARHLILPTLCLALSGWAYAAHYSRAAFRTLFVSGLVTSARARGLAGLRLTRHLAPNALLALVSLLGTIVPGLVAGSVVVEEVFSWPGTGRLLLHAVEGRDYPTVLATILISALAVLAGQLSVDLLYPALDPRLRETIVSAAEQSAS